MRLEIWLYSEKQPKYLEADGQGTVAELKARACALFKVPESGVHIWDFFQHGKYKALEGSLGENLQEARIMDDQPILLEDKAAALKVPELLRRRADMELVFKDGSTLPANADLLSIHSPVLRHAIAAERRSQRQAGLAAAPAAAAAAAPAGGDDSEEDGSPAGDGAGVLRVPVADDPKHWLLALRLVYGESPTPRLSLDEVRGVLELGLEYDMVGPLAPCCEAALLNEVKVGRWPFREGVAFWEVFVLAARCKMRAAVLRCCELAAYGLEVPDGFRLGPAAQPLAVYMLNVRRSPANREALQKYFASAPPPSLPDWAFDG